MFSRDVINVERDSRIMTQSTTVELVEKVSVMVALLRRGQSLREAGDWHLYEYVMPVFRTEASQKVQYNGHFIGYTRSTTH